MENIKNDTKIDFVVIVNEVLEEVHRMYFIETKIGKAAIENEKEKIENILEYSNLIVVDKFLERTFNHNLFKILDSNKIEELRKTVIPILAKKIIECVKCKII